MSVRSPKLCAVSVDLDEIPNYFHIHGMVSDGMVSDGMVPDAQAATAVYDVAMDRLAALSRDADVPLTLFTIGADLARPEAAAKLREAHARGAEIANHTLDHRYDLTKLSREAVRAQVQGGIDAIRAAVGEPPVGFRAPGYTITDDVFEVLRELDVDWVVPGHGAAWHGSTTDLIAAYRAAEAAQR